MTVPKILYQFGTALPAETHVAEWKQKKEQLNIEELHQFLTGTKLPTDLELRENIHRH
jgi:hypothetical protein